MLGPTMYQRRRLDGSAHHRCSRPFLGPGGDGMSPLRLVVEFPASDDLLHLALFSLSLSRSPPLSISSVCVCVCVCFGSESPFAVVCLFSGNTK